MIDPKMLELSVYDGIPHLLAPVVTDPKKAVVALKWTVREMEDRYRRMSKLGVRNIASYNERAREAQAKGEHFERTVQTGFDDQGRPVYESEKIRPEPLPYLVVVMDEMADLMLVAGKDVEGAVQRLAQMARAAGIHLIMATQRPSVDVITGTIKANFPTRISFQVTSKIDSRTILGEQGGEQLLGQGDMLYMAGGGRITRLHGPFVTDAGGRGRLQTPARPGRARLSGPDHRRSGRRRRRGLRRGRRRLGRRPLRPRRGRGHPRPQGLDLLCPAPPADRLQPRRLPDRADGAGRRRSARPTMPASATSWPARRRCKWGASARDADRSLLARDGISPPAGRWPSRRAASEAGKTAHWNRNDERASSHRRNMVRLVSCTPPAPTGA